jgi:drug/metabolite transporter (DMT)-like permease
MFIKTLFPFYKIDQGENVTPLIWTLGILIALLTAFNTISWGFAIKEVGDPQLSLDFLLRLVFNKWYVLALASALVASILSYAVLREMGVLLGRFFLSLSMVAVILASTFVLGEKLTSKEWIGVTIIMIGVLLIGR